MLKKSPRWRPSGLDQAIGALAARQGGNVTRAQLTALGVKRGEIEHRIIVGRLIPVYRGVFAVGRPPATPIERAHAALLACGERSALSHASAAAFWGIYERWPARPELTAATDRRPSGVIVHRSATLIRAEVVAVECLRVTSPARTILDVAPRLSDRRLARVVNDQRLARRLTLGELARLVRRLPCHPGAPRLAPVLAVAQREPTRSQLEDAFQRFHRSTDLPPYQLNVRICGYRVDFFFPAPVLLIVELDGWEAHRTREQFISNRRQDADILAQTGIPTVRLVYDDIEVQWRAAQTRRRLEAIVARRRAEAR
jgi:very-short-patch-repair endonuclease